MYKTIGLYVVWSVDTYTNRNNMYIVYEYMKLLDCMANKLYRWQGKTENVEKYQESGCKASWTTNHQQFHCTPSNTDHGNDRRP